LKDRASFWRASWFRFVLGTLVSLTFLYLAVKDVPLPQVAETLGRANYGWALAAIGVMVLQSWLRAVRWMRLFYPLQSGLRLRQMWSITLISQMLNIAAPWRVGDLARIYLAGEIEKRSKAQVLATLGTEKVFDTCMLLALLLGIPFFMTLPAWLEQPRDGLIVASLALFSVALVLVLSRDQLLKLLGRVSIPWRGESLNGHAAAALSSLDVFKRWDVHIELQGLSLGIWSLGVLTNLLILLALGLSLPLVASFLLLAVLQVGGFVPSSPGKVGVFQALCIGTLSLFSVDKSMGLAYGILLYLIAYGTPVISGLACLWWQGVHLERILSGAKAQGAR
jgi:uncharacterized protein (TIRG00374 family)